MANHTTGAERYNNRMQKIWDTAKALETAKKAAMFPELVQALELLTSQVNSIEFEEGFWLPLKDENTRALAVLAKCKEAR